MENIGWIYIITDLELHLIKVGRTKNINKRLTHYKTGSLYPVALLGAFKINNYWEVEKQIHKEFFKDRFKGEWFISKPDTIINYIFDNYQNDIIEWFEDNLKDELFRALQTRIEWEKIYKLRQGINPVVNFKKQLKFGNDIINAMELMNELSEYLKIIIQEWHTKK